MKATAIVTPSPQPGPADPAEPATPRLPPLQSLEEMRAGVQQQPAWLWHGYLAAGNVTLLTSQWKSGKTTLLSVLLSKLGGGELAGLPVAPAQALVVSEEGAAHWCRRAEKLEFGGRVHWLCRPFRGKPRQDDWLALLDRALDWKEKHRLDLLVIDTLASFLPGRDENSAGVMLSALLPLQRLTAVGVSVLVLHHPRKGELLIGQAARGSGALAGYVDIVVEMYHADRADLDDRRRVLRAFSRHEESPRPLVIELNPAGIDYTVLAEPPEEAFDSHWELLRSVLEDQITKITRREILKQWPVDYRPPSDSTLWTWLERAVALGLLRRDGNGHKRSPFRYWLPEREKRLLEDLPDLDPMEW